MSSERAYSKGSKCPPLTPGLLRLYSMRFCPYSQRTIIFLKYLDVPHEIINVNLRQKPDWIFDKNPTGLVPIIELDGKIIYESNICNEFLDEVYGNNQLLTKDPSKRAQQKMMLERFNNTLIYFYGLQNAIKPEDICAQAEKLENDLKQYECVLSKKLFGGDDPNFLDLSLWPWFERMYIFAKYKGVDILNRESKFPKLLAWMSSMKSLPAIKSTSPSMEFVEQFIMENYNVFNTHPNYDLGLTC